MECQRQVRWMVRTFFCFGLFAAAQWTAMANLEVDALHALRQALVDPEKVLESWNISLVNPCTWFHVTCNADDYVIRIDLGNAALLGTLVPELGQLSQLQYLEMYNNNLSGSIPTEISNLTNLVSLDLYENLLSGDIPASLGNLAGIRFLRLNNNFLSGSIPESLTFLDTLQVFDVSFNQLEGKIPVTGVFTHFNFSSFEGNPDLYYTGTALAPSPDYNFEHYNRTVTMESGSSPLLVSSAKSLIRLMVIIGCSLFLIPVVMNAYYIDG